ncbi:MAG: hypothetical protein A2283_11620 [Lentisphaerae bacterium RIFOXYA12_FULL_48_11]|nr:MAG: hypothetical protein A2283_11620 [Lentisphaerae bacterium RIFOXYA12_FULL_48_11]
MTHHKNDLSQMQNALLSTTIEHAQRGYQNAQETIRFVDTKTGVLTGLCCLLLGAGLELIKTCLAIGVYKAPFNGHAIDSWCIVAGIALLIFAISGIGCIIASIHSLTARPPLASTGFTVLFPFFTPPARSTAEEYARKIVVGMKESEIAEEYQNQIISVGAILEEKCKWHRRAVLYFRAEVLSLFALGAAVFLFSHFSKL